MQNSGFIWCKKELSWRNYEDSQRRGTKLHLHYWKAISREQIENKQKLEGEIATRENLGFWTKLPALRPALFREIANFLFYAILAQFEAEYCETRKTKFIRKRSKNNPEVEAQQTVEHRERKPEKNPAAAQEIPADAEFRFRAGIRPIQTKFVRANWSNLSTQVLAWF